MSPFAAVSPTVKDAYPIDAVADAEALYNAMKGLGTDEDTLIKILGKRSFKQRRLISDHYLQKYGKELLDELLSENSGDFATALKAIMTEVPEFYADELHRCISGWGTDEDCIIEILSSLTGRELSIVENAYNAKYNRSLEEDLKDDTSGSFKNLLTDLCLIRRNENYFVCSSCVDEDARRLQEAVGTESAEEVFRDIFSKRSFDQLKEIKKEYKKIVGDSLKKAIESTFSGDAQELYLALVEVAECRIKFLAERLHRSVKGPGTKDHTLIRLIVARSEIDLKDISKRFESKYEKSLKSAIKDDTSGDYRHLLVELLD